jgi:alkanesulfonate monooxygenase SsuD/methylene tetrahydromethanopterin reductase-like flavin-dependent oxidoreductase (luciferase family)
MKFGFIMPRGTADQLLDLAQEIEAAGWDGFFYWDGIGIGDSDVFDPWAILAAVAVKTERVTLGAMIFPLSRRRPWKVARETITVDHLSHGRLVIPVGLGALDDGGFSRVHPEVTDRGTRAELLDETLEILDRAWRGETFSYAGRHYQMENMTFRPKPVQQPRIPVWVVGAWPRPRSMARAARWDGIIPSISGDPFRALTPPDIREIRAWLTAHRDDGTPGEIVLEGVSPGDDPAWVESDLRPLADAGATWWIESRWEAPNDVETLRARIRQGPPKLQAAAAS